MTMTMTTDEMTMTTDEMTMTTTMTDDHSKTKKTKKTKKHFFYNKMSFQKSIQIKKIELISKSI